MMKPELYKCTDGTHVMVNHQGKVYHITGANSYKYLGVGPCYRNQVSGVKLRSIPLGMRGLFYKLNKA